MGEYRNKIAIVSAVIAFLGMHYLLTLGSNYMASNSNNFLIWQPWLNLMALSLYLISGAIAGILSKHRFVYSGFLAGFVSALSAVLLFGVGGGEPAGILLTVAWGLVFGGLGGWLSALVKNRIANAL